VRGVFTINGFSFAGIGENTGVAFVNLKDWEDRSGGANKTPAIAARAMRVFSQFRDAKIFAIVPPAVQELGAASGFDMELVDDADIGHQKLLAAGNMMLGNAAQDKTLAGVRPHALDDAPQLKVDIDHDNARALGLDLADVNDIISTAWGGSYINDFIDRVCVKRVSMQTDEPYRLAPEDMGNFYVRGSTGAMAPFTGFSTLSWSQEPVQLTRYNGLPAMEILGQSAPGRSSATAMAAMAAIHAKLPPGTSLEWTGLNA
jgi:multidrug efflux pump